MAGLPLLPALLFLVLAGPMACDGSPPPSAEEAGFWPTPREPATPRVLLIGIDGVRVDVLRDVPTPNLDALAEAGSFTDDARNVRPTVSGPCWSSMLTGVPPALHGVTSNDFSSNHYQAYPDFLTRIEMMRPDLGTFAAADWLPLATDDSGGPLISQAVDRRVALDGYEYGWSEADSMSVDATVEEIRNGDAHAIFVYLGAPDEISHEIGGIHEPYRQAVAAADRHVGRLVDAVKSRPDFPREDWLILVSTDHGRTAEGSHGGDSPEESTVFFLASGPGAVHGRPEGPVSIMDVAATALAHLGIQVDPEWEMEGKVVGIHP